MENDKFKAFIVDLKKRINEIEKPQDDYVPLFKDMLQAIESFNSLYADALAGSADQRLAKKRLEQAKIDFRTIEKRLEKAKNIAISVIPPVKQVSGDLSSVQDLQAAARIRAAVQKMAEALVEITKA